MPRKRVTFTGGGEVFYEAATVLASFVLLGAARHPRTERPPPPKSAAGQRLPLRVSGPLAGLPATGADQSAAGRRGIARRRGGILGTVNAGDQRGHPASDPTGARPEERNAGMARVMPPAVPLPG